MMQQNIPETTSLRFYVVYLLCFVTFTTSNEMLTFRG